MGCSQHVTAENSRCVESKPDSDIKSAIGEIIDVLLEGGTEEEMWKKRQAKKGEKQKGRQTAGNKEQDLAGLTGIWGWRSMGAGKGESSDGTQGDLSRMGRMRPAREGGKETGYVKEGEVARAGRVGHPVCITRFLHKKNMHNGSIGYDA